MFPHNRVNSLTCTQWTLQLCNLIRRRPGVEVTVRANRCPPQVTKSIVFPLPNVFMAITIWTPMRRPTWLSFWSNYMSHHLTFFALWLVGFHYRQGLRANIEVFSSCSFAVKLSAASLTGCTALYEMHVSIWKNSITYLLFCLSFKRAPVDFIVSPNHVWIFLRDLRVRPASVLSNSMSCFYFSLQNSTTLSLNTFRI